MDKQKVLISEQTELTWLTDWSHYLSEAPFNLKERNSAEIAALLQALIAASLQGDSGLLVSSAAVEHLAPYVLPEQQALEQVAPMVYDGHLLALHRYWSLEQRLAQQLIRLHAQAVRPVNLDLASTLLSDPHQQAALSMVAKQALSLITGGPGTGKTYTLARIIAVLNQNIANIRIAMAAPTGKAAQRMQEALQTSFNDEKLLESGLINPELKQQQTQTLHRLLGLGTRQIPQFHAKQPLPYDVVVIDEASMLDLRLATLLFEAIAPDCRLILLGDAKQLSSVDVGSVLADLQQIPLLVNNQVELKTSRRFNAEAEIGKLAQFIQAVDIQATETDVLAQFEKHVASAAPLQAIDITSSMSDRVQLDYLPNEINDVTPYYEQLMHGYEAYVKQLQAYQHANFDADRLAHIMMAFDQYRILVAIRFGHFGLEQINRYAKAWLMQRLSAVDVGGWYIGRPVMMTYNDYQLGLSNGDIGICLRDRQQPDQFEVYFPSLAQWVAAHRLPKNIQTAFALTIHKSQGSEFAHSAVVFDDTAQKILSQELIYTAITRAKTVVSLLVSREALAQALLVKTTRVSGLVTKVNKIL